IFIGFGKRGLIVDSENGFFGSTVSVVVPMGTRLLNILQTSVAYLSYLLKVTGVEGSVSL
ncbi:hypothetical protein V4Y02_24095, partial [Escherichia coli]